MPVCSHRITDWAQMNIVYRQREIEALNVWTEKEDVAWKELSRYSAEKKCIASCSCRGAAGLVWSQPGSICVFLSPLYGLRQGFSSPEVMMASFLAEIWKEQEILWLSSERWLYYWDATNKGWCRPGIPRLALSLSFLPLWSLSFQLSLYFSPRHREGLQYLGLIRKHIHLCERRHNKINRSLSVCWKSLTATCAMIRPPLTAVLYKSQQSHCRLFTSQACDEAASHTLAEFPARASHSVNTHTIHLPPSKFFLLSQKSYLRDKAFWRRQALPSSHLRLVHKVVLNLQRYYRVNELSVSINITEVC